MKVVWAFVTSLDGKLTRWGEPQIERWTSKEDQRFFAKLRSQQEIVIMGRNTFVAVKPKLSPKILRVVLTRSPARYRKRAVPGQLEFTNENPLRLIQRLKKSGYRRILLAGGSISLSFLKHKLVDEVWVTVEPRMFGQGNMLVSHFRLNGAFRLLSTKRLNRSGTLLLHYRIVK